MGNSDPQNGVMWLDGRTDAQKSAICHTVAQICVEQHLLSGSFSFRRTTTNLTGKHDASGLIATLIYQLLLHIPETRNYIAEKIAVDISILDSSWETQLDALLVQPLVAVAKNGFPQDARPRLFIIDGLDECDDKTQCIVVESFTAALQKIPQNIPHKLLFSSRSESHLVSICRIPPISAHVRRLRLKDCASSPESLELSLVESFTDLKDKFRQLLEVAQQAILSLTRDIQRLEKRSADAEKERDELLDRNKALETEMGVITAANRQLERDLDDARTELQKEEMSNQEVSNPGCESGASVLLASPEPSSREISPEPPSRDISPEPPSREISSEREPPSREISPEPPQTEHLPPLEERRPVRRSSFTPLSLQPQPLPPPVGHVRRPSFNPLSLPVPRPRSFSSPKRHRLVRSSGLNSNPPQPPLHSQLRLVNSDELCRYCGLRYEGNVHRC